MIAKVTLTIAVLLSLSSPNAAWAQDQIPSSHQQIKLSFAPVVKQVAPAVVNIYTKRQVQVRYRSPFFNDPFFSRFMDDSMFGGHMRQRVENSLGSGVIISSTGQIVTNTHVIKGADEITVILNDGQEYEAEITLQDEPSDLTLLQIKNLDKDLPYARLSPSESLEVGDLVVAIGNPFGVGQSVSSGIVSAQGRSALNVNNYNFFIQTDAAINPGNSGGALIDLDGNVVGINTAIYSRDGGSLGIGFAIPSEMVSAIISAAKQGQTGTAGIMRPWLGYSGQNVTSDIAQSLGLAKPNGVLISHLNAHSPLKKAGLQTGDIITALNDKAIKDNAELKFRMATIRLGQKAKITFLRKGKKKNVQFTSISAPEKPARDSTKITNNTPFSGATLANLNPAIAYELGLDEDITGQHVIITDAQAGSAINRIAKIGDIIVEINGDKITSARQAAKIIKKLDNSRAWNITINSNGRMQRIILR